MRFSVPIYTLKRRARKVARTKGVPLHRALDIVALEEGFQSWNHLAATWAESSPAKRLLAQTRPGTLCVLAARPGQGKTMLGLELALLAAQGPADSHFMTLDYTPADVTALLATLGISPDQTSPCFHLDTSDQISAEYICARLGPGVSCVVDYMQLLDQDRSRPPLSEQLMMLRDGAAQAKARVVLISQIDRGFDLQTRKMPELRDIRLPNPADLSLFETACFLHEGQMELSAVA